MKDKREGLPFEAASGPEALVVNQSQLFITNVLHWPFEIQ